MTRTVTFDIAQALAFNATNLPSLTIVNAANRNVRTVDIAPTMAKLLIVPVPASLDNIPLTGVVQ